MDKEKMIDHLDRQTFAYHEMQPESPEDYTAEYKKGYNEGLKFAIAYIDQLDEPEKVVIPTFVGEWIEHEKKEELFNPTDIRGLIKERGFPKDYKIRDWFSENKQNEITFMRAWLDGYTVEEKKYEVKFCTGGTLQGNPSVIVLYESVGGEILAKEMLAENYRDSKERVPSSYHLTEKQIKDYDSRFWPFAEEVTE